MGAVPAPELNRISMFFVFALQYAFEIAKVVFILTLLCDRPFIRKYAKYGALVRALQCGHSGVIAPV